MAKKAAKKKTATKKTAKKSATKRASARTRLMAGKKGVDFKPLHDAMDEALAALQAHKPSAQRDELISRLKQVRSVEFCPKHAMFAELV
jgi:hypothetical protein